MRKNGIKNSNKGYNIIEVIIAMGILVVGIAGLAPLFVSGQKQLNKSGDKTEAINYAQAKIEEFRRNGYTGDGTDDTGTSSTFSYMQISWRGNRIVGPDSLRRELWSVTVVVSWTRVWGNPATLPPAKKAQRDYELSNNRIEFRTNVTN